MTSKITLELDHDGVRLFRQEAGGEVEAGRARLDDPGFDAALTALRERTFPAGEAEVEVLLPPSLVLFLDVGDADDTAFRERVQEEADCPIEDLIIERFGSTAAAVERATLEEAREFTEGHGFRPLAYSARRTDAGGGMASFSLDSGPMPTFRSHRAAAEAAFVETPEPAGPQIRPTRDTADSVAEPSNTPNRSRPPAVAATAGPGRAAERAALVPAITPPRVGPAETEAEALTIFGARDREQPSRGLTPLHVVAALLAAAVLFAAFQLFDGADAPDLVEIGSDGAIADAPLDGAPQASIASDEPGADDGGIAGVESPHPAMKSERIAEAAPRSKLALAPALPGPTLRSDPPGVAALEPPAADGASVDAGYVTPPAPGSVFEMDERGLVRPTEDGAMTPQGVLLRSGPPPLLPPESAVGSAAADPDPIVAETQDDAAAGETAEPAEAASSAPDIARVAPVPRPEDESAALRPKVLAANDDTPRPAARPEEIETAAAPSAASAPRAPDFNALAQQARTDTASAAAGLATRAAAPPPPEPEGRLNVAVQPSLPTRSSVAERATIANAIRLDRLNLIGVYGSAADRRALIRLPTGRYMKVKVGDRVDGGQVAAIRASQVDYVKGGRRYSLTLPNG